MTFTKSSIFLASASSKKCTKELFLINKLDEGLYIVKTSS